MTTDVTPRTAARRLIVLAGLSAGGDGITRTLLPLAAAAAPGADALVGLVQTAARLPWLLVSLPAGRVVDRRGAGPVLLAGLILKVAGLIAIAAAVLGSYWWLLALAAVIAVTGEVLFETATQVSVVHDFDARDRPRTNSTLQAVQVSLGQFLGPTVAGLAWQWHAATAVGVAFMAQLGAVRARRSWQVKRGPGVTARPAAGAPRWSAGMRALWSSPALRATTVIGTVSMLAYGLWSACFVLYVTGPGGLDASGAVFGLLVGCPAIGSLLGSRLFPPLLRRVTAFGGLVAMVLGQVGLFLPSALGAGVPAVAAGLVVYGLGLAGWSGGVLAYRQAAVPRDVYGQVTGAYRFVSWGASPVGALLGAFVVSRASVSAAMLAGLCLVLVQAPLVAWARSLHTYRGDEP